MKKFTLDHFSHLQTDLPDKTRIFQKILSNQVGYFKASRFDHYVFKMVYVHFQVSI